MGKFLTIMSVPNHSWGRSNFFLKLHIQIIIYYGLGKHFEYLKIFQNTLANFKFFSFFENAK